MSSAYFYFNFFGIRQDASYEDKAQLYASKSLLLDSNCAQAYLVLGLIEFKKGNVQEATHTFKKMLELDPNNTDGFVWLMCAYIISGRPEAAIPVSEKLIQVDPLSVFSYSMPGDIKFYSGHIKESLPYFRRWLQIDPEDTYARYLCAYNFAVNNELKESIDVLDSLIKDMPTLIYAKFALFFKSSLQGDRESALRYATEELKREAASLGQFSITMAYGFALINEKDEAVSWLKRSLDFGYSPYPLMLKFKIFHHVLKDHPGFHEYMDEIKKRSEQFVV
jgi:tetratricopeptide (TPR) repeat protein